MNYELFFSNIPWVFELFGLTGKLSFNFYSKILELVSDWIQIIKA